MGPRWEHTINVTSVRHRASYSHTYSYLERLILEYPSTGMSSVDGRTERTHQTLHYSDPGAQASTLPAVSPCYPTTKQLIGVLFSFLKQLICNILSCCVASLFCVNALVLSKVRPASKTLPALGALVWLLSRVDALMNLEAF